MNANKSHLHTEDHMRNALKKTLPFLLFVILLINTGCSPAPAELPASSPDAEKLKVVTTLFPLYDFSRTMLGDKGDVTLLLPPGVEAHAYEPTPQDIVRINKADVFIYTGEAMEPWAHKIIEAIENKSLVIIDASTGIELIKSEAHDEDEGESSESESTKNEEEEEHHHGTDPHIWLDPVLASQMVDTIAKGLIQADPDLGKHVTVRQDALKADLEVLNQKFIETFKKTQYNRIIYGGHFAFGYFATRYGLEHISPYEGFSPDAEPTPARIAQLIDTLEASESKVIYFEELIDPRVSKVIAEETGAEMLMLHGAHNVSKDEMAKGITYIQIMEQNLVNLKKGLNYRE